MLLGGQECYKTSDLPGRKRKGCRCKTNGESCQKKKVEGLALQKQISLAKKKKKCSWRNSWSSVVKSTDCSSRVADSIPSNHMVAHNRLQWDQTPSSGVSEDSNSVYSHKYFCF